MPDIRLSFTLSVLVLLILVSGAVALAYFSYRVTVPPVSVRLRRVLTALRAMSLTFLAVLIAEPLLTLVTTVVEPPVVLVLADNTLSMTLRDGERPRSDDLLAVLGSPRLHDAGVTADLRLAALDMRVRPFAAFTPESLSFSGERTDLASSLASVKRSAASWNLQAVVLVSDGISTTGSNPIYEAEELGVPVFTVGIGDTADIRDVRVRNVLSNSIAYAATRVPVNVTLQQNGFAGSRVEVVLQSGGTTLDRATVDLHEGTGDIPVSLSFLPEGEGTRRFIVSVAPLPGEQETRNNTASFFVRILKNKLRVVLVAPVPSPDVGAIRRILTEDENIELHSFTGRVNGRPRDGDLTRQALDRADAIVTVGFPATASLPADVAAVAAAASAGKPLLWVAARSMQVDLLRGLESVLPFSIQQGSESEYQVLFSIADAHRNHPVVRLGPDGSATWSSLPPLFRVPWSIRTKPESEVLGRARVQTVTLNDPLLLTRNVNRLKSVAVLGYGLWRWPLLADRGTERFLELFLNNTLRWLTARDDSRTVRIAPTQQSFTSHEPVTFSAQVYDESYVPVENAEVTVTVRRQGTRMAVGLSSLGTGQYDGGFDRLPSGEYAYEGVVRRDGEIVGQDQGVVSVGGLPEEFIETRTNRHLLRQIAERTGGVYRSAGTHDDLGRLIADLPGLKPRTSVHTRERELWNSPWLLSVVLVLLAAEWFLRKRFGLL